jgi:TonB family protein
MYRHQAAIRTSAIATASFVIACVALPVSAQAAGADHGAVANFKSCAKPNYPDADLKARHQGTVTLGFLVGADGKVGDSKVAKSSGHPGLDEAARMAIAQCSFEPAVKGDKPVKEWTKVQYVWSLD